MIPARRSPALRPALLGLALALLSAAPLPAQKLPEIPPSPGRRVGDLAHDFTLQDLDGKTHRLKDLRGKKVVHVVFWATWCVPCIQEIPVLREQYVAHRGQGLEILGVVINQNQTPDIVRVISQHYKVNYPILFDTDDAARGKYRVELIPQNFLIDRQGVIRYADTSLPRDYDGLIRKLLAEGGPAPAAPRPPAKSH